MDPSKPSTPADNTEDKSKVNNVASGAESKADWPTSNADKSTDGVETSSPAEAPDAPEVADSSLPSPSVPSTEVPAEAPSTDTSPADSSAWPSSASDSSAPTTPSVDPSMAAPASGAPVDPLMTPKPKKKGLVMGLIAAAAVLVIGGGAAAAYFGYVVPNKPENVLKTALGNTLSGKADSMYVEGTFDVTDKSNDTTITADLTGKANSKGAFQVNFDVDAIVAKVNLEIRSVDGSNFYVKVGGLSGLPELLQQSGEAEVAQMYGPIIKQIDGQWYDISQNFLKQLGFDLKLGSTLSEADKKKVVDLYNQHQFLTVKQKMADEAIKDMPSYHMQVIVNKSELKAYMKALADANINELGIGKDQVTAFNKMIDEDDVDFSKYPLDIWITKDTKMIDQIKFSISDPDASATFQVTMYDFNKPVSVSKPSGTKPIIDLLTSIYGSQGGVDEDVLQGLQGLQGSTGISL